MLQFIGRQEMTEMKRSGIEVVSWIRRNPKDLRGILVFADGRVETKWRRGSLNHRRYNYGKFIGRHSVSIFINL